MSAVDFSNPRYFGQATISVDSKGRIFIPTKWHDQIGESVILHIGLSRMGSGRYLELTTPEVFDAFIDRLDALPSTNRRFDQLKSMILGNSEKIFLDKQSRILLPKNLIEYANLGSEITLVGNGKYLQLWSPDAYKRSEEAYDHSSLCNDLDSLNSEIDGLFGYGGAVNG